MAASCVKIILFVVNCQKYSLLLQTTPGWHTEMADESWVRSLIIFVMLLADTRTKLETI